MGIKKEFCKIFFKLIDATAYTDFFPKIINRNSSTMNKNDYNVSDEYDYIFVHVHRTGGTSFRSLIEKINKYCRASNGSRMSEWFKKRKMGDLPALAARLWGERDGRAANTLTV